MEGKNIYIKSDQTETHAIWELTTDFEVILNSNQVVFCEDTHEPLFEIMKTYHFDPIFFKYPLLFDIGGYNPQQKKITITLDPHLKINLQLLHRDKYFQQFMQYVKEVKSVSYVGENNYQESSSSNYYLRIDKIYKAKFNEHGIYVRPTKGILEYSPKKAAKQLLISTNRKKRKQSTPLLTLYDINRLSDGLQRILNDNFRLSFTRHDYYFPLNRYGTSDYCAYLICLIQKLIIPSTTYRNLSSFKMIKKIWPKISDKNRNFFSKEFCQLMDSEIRKIPPSSKIRQTANPRILKSYHLIKQENPNANL